MGAEVGVPVGVSVVVVVVVLSEAYGRLPVELLLFPSRRRSSMDKASTEAEPIATITSSSNQVHRSSTRILL